MERTKNRDRANRASAALLTYAESVGEEPSETGLGDLLVDMMHLAHLNRWTWDTLTARALNHFTEELAGRDDD